jgi:hypothetical protein
MSEKEQPEVLARSSRIATVAKQSFLFVQRGDTITDSPERMRTAGSETCEIVLKEQIKNESEAV